MKEIWKDIVGYEGLYKISNNGNVLALERKIERSGMSDRKAKQKLLLPLKMPNGYLQIGLNKNKQRRSFSIHRLVAKAFIYNENNSLVINHKNGDKADNRVDNLEWCTQSENVKHSYAHGLQKPNNVRLVINLETGVYYESLIDAAKSITHIKHKALFAMMKGYNPNRSNFIFA